MWFKSQVCQAVAALALGLSWSVFGVGSVVHVDDDAPPGGDGASWDTAYRFLQDGLTSAAKGGVTEIRVAQGIYKPDRDEANPNGTGDRAASFHLINGVALMGGYAGIGAKDPDAHDIELYETILSGDLLGDDEPNFVNNDENSFHVLSASKTGEQTVLDGFVVSSGSADDFGANSRGGGLTIEDGQLVVLNSTFDGHLAESRGGAIYGFQASLTFVGCEFVGNFATDNGGGIAALGGTLDIRDCIFEGNMSEGTGGGILTSAPTSIIGCSFISNSALQGGGISSTNAGPRGVVIELTDCTFRGNTCLARGGAVRHTSDGGLSVSGCAFVDNHTPFQGGAVYTANGLHTFSDCVFDSNTADDGGALYNALGSELTFTDCAFTNNIGQGGAIYNNRPISAYTNCTFTGNSSTAVYEYRSSFQYTACVFEENVADGGPLLRGGAVHIYDHLSEGTFLDCVFRGNSALVGSGALFINGGDSQVINCDFISNSVDREGGAVGCAYGAPTFFNCRFINNSAVDEGGAIYISHGATPEFFACLLAGNATERGGAAFVTDSGPTFENCTMVSNSASLDGGGVAVIGENGTASLANCILWGNDAGGEVNESTQVFLDAGGTVDVNYCCVEGWTDTLGGIGNIGDDPLFVDPDGPDGIPGTEDDDLHLSPGSPCIDAGHNWYVPLDENDYDEDGVLCELFPVDLDGNPRFNADEADFDPGCGVPVVVDMGAYEYQFDPADQVTFADLNGDGAVGVKDLLGLLGSWGPCAKGCCLADLDLDGDVGVKDLLFLLGAWGPCL